MSNHALKYFLSDNFIRWDMQRMRQEQQLQKLRARQEKQHAAQSKKEETTSLLPSLEVMNKVLMLTVVIVCF